jgi:hypothetical protein
MRKVFMFVVVPVGVAGSVLGVLRFWHGAPPWIIALIAFSPALVGIIVHGFSLSDDYLKRWTKAHGVTITDGNSPVIRRYLLRGRRIRTSGALAGYTAYYIWVSFRHDDSGVSWFTATFAGYLIGAALAEIWAFRPEPGRIRSASLTPRRMTDYVPRLAVVLMRALPIAMIALVAAWPAFPERRFEFPRRDQWRPSLWPTLVWLGVALLLWLFVESTARRIVRRPQPMMSEDLIAADDAIRSTAIHGLMGAGLALMLGIFSQSLARWNSHIEPLPPNNFIMIISILCGLGSLFAWLRLGIDQPWVVQRSKPPQEVAA